MKFEEKKRMKREEIAELFKGLGELIERGELRVGGEALPTLDSAEVEVEYKEKKGRAKLEIEIKWRPGKRPMQEKHIEETLPTISEVKQSLKRAFKTLRSSIEAGETPSSEEVEEFAALNRAFEDLAKGQEYEKDMADYVSLVRSLTDAVKAGETEQAKRLIEEMRAAKKSCHKTYRWKEEE